MATKPKVILSQSEQIFRIRKKEGRTQRWIIGELASRGHLMSDSTFSQKKDNEAFSIEELDILVEILPGFTY